MGTVDFMYLYTQWTAKSLAVATLAELSSNPAANPKSLQHGLTTAAFQASLFQEWPLAALCTHWSVLLPPMVAYLEDIRPVTHEWYARFNKLCAAEDDHIDRSMFFTCLWHNGKPVGLITVGQAKAWAKNELGLTT